MIYFEGYVFKFELITMVTHICSSQPMDNLGPFNNQNQITQLYSFTVYIDDKIIIFEYTGEEEAKDGHNKLIDTIHKHGYVGGWEKR